MERSELCSESPRTSQSYNKIGTDPQRQKKYIKDGNKLPWKNQGERKIQSPSLMIVLYVMKMGNELSRRQNAREALHKTEEMISRTRYGSITLVIQDGVVVQIERKEKERLK